MENVKKHLDILGLRVEDKVTGFKGVATSVSFDLYGCIQVVIRPGLDKDGKPMEAQWFDIARLKITSKKPVMKPPVWDMRVLDAQVQSAKGKKGPESKTLPPNC